MKIGFLVNDVATERSVYTTTRLALSARQKGHEVWLVSVADVVCEADGSMSATAFGPKDKQYKSLERFLADVQGGDDDGAGQPVDLCELDVVLLRNDPADDAAERPWAPPSAVAFGRMLADTGVLVLNDPAHLSLALTKAYFQHLPEVVRPRTLITRDQAAIAQFITEQAGEAVLKPLQGSGGSGVFKVTAEESPNLNQIIEAIARDGYVVAQEYLPEAVEGDVRMFVMNGAPLRAGDQVAAFRRVNESADLRSNMSVGGKAVAVEVTDRMLQLVDLVRPQLIADGMFLVGLDIVGDKLMEVNVFSPGGLGSCGELYGVDFAAAVITELERKVELRHHYPHLRNAQLATL